MKTNERKTLQEECADLARAWHEFVLAVAGVSRLDRLVHWLDQLVRRWQ